jgi:hypothetical protein
MSLERSKSVAPKNCGLEASTRLRMLIDQFWLGLQCCKQRGFRRLQFTRIVLPQHRKLAQSGSHGGGNGNGRELDGPSNKYFSARLLAPSLLYQRALPGGSAVLRLCRKCHEKDFQNRNEFRRTSGRGVTGPKRIFGFSRAVGSCLIDPFRM